MARVENRVATGGAPARTKPSESRGEIPWWGALVALAVFFGVMWLIPALLA